MNLPDRAHYAIIPVRGAESILEVLARLEVPTTSLRGHLGGLPLEDFCMLTCADFVRLDLAGALALTALNPPHYMKLKDGTFCEVRPQDGLARVMGRLKGVKLLPKHAGYWLQGINSGRMYAIV